MKEYNHFILGIQIIQLAELCYLSCQDIQIIILTHLENHKNTPEMPTGYPGMMILSLIPPLWFYVMNHRVKKFIH